MNYTKEKIIELLNINNVKQKATVMLQNALPKRNFLPPPGERKKYV